MTAIIYFGEMLVVSIFAIVLLVISPLELGSAAAVFVSGVALGRLPNTRSIALCSTISRQGNMGCIMPTLTNRSSQSFGKYGFVSRWSIL
jgi:hypothetical protein